jgi:3-hydroxybutyryl-CoA dehydrogenase
MAAPSLNAYARAMRATREESAVRPSQGPIRVGVVGAGVMGAGIAQVALEAGDEVRLHDVDPAALTKAEARIRDGLTRRALKLDLDPDSVDDWADGRIGGLRLTPDLAATATEAEVVIEAAAEDLELKQRLFRALDLVAPVASILASNTSALPITAIGEATSRPERVIGLHFFNPAPLMPLVEVVRSAVTDQAVREAATAHVKRWGKTAVECTDAPGFIVNRVNRPFTIQALRLLEGGDASVEEIDSAIRDGGFPMGPFELMDLAGLDVNLAAATGVWEGLGRPDRLRPSRVQAELVAAGSLGRKTGEGFYRYEDGRRAAVARRFATAPGTMEPDQIRDRLLDAIDAEARQAVDDGVASAEDIDLALKLGAGHPLGPFERRRGR